MVQHNNTDAADPVVKVLLKRLELIRLFVQKRDVSVPKTVQAQLTDSGVEKLALRTANRLHQVVTNVLPGHEHRQQIEYFAAAFWPWPGRMAGFIRKLGQGHDIKFLRSTREAPRTCRLPPDAEPPPKPIITDIYHWIRWLDRKHDRVNFSAKKNMQDLGYATKGPSYPGTTRLRWTDIEVNAAEIEALHFGCREAYRTPNYVRLAWSRAAQRATEQIAADRPEALKAWLGILTLPHLQHGAFRTGRGVETCNWSWQHHRRLIAPDRTKSVRNQPKKIITAVSLLHDLNSLAYAVKPNERTLHMHDPEVSADDGTRAQCWLDLHEQIGRARRRLPYDLVWFKSPDHPRAHVPFRLLNYLFGRWCRSRRTHAETIVYRDELIRVAYPDTPVSRTTANTRTSALEQILDQLVDLVPMYGMSWKSGHHKGKPAYRVVPPPGWLLRRGDVPVDLFREPIADAPLVGSDLTEWRKKYRFRSRVELATALEDTEKHLRDIERRNDPLESGLQTKLEKLARARGEMQQDLLPWIEDPENT